VALDKGGVVGRWNTKYKITTFGPKRIGFLNFGKIGKIKVEAPMGTLGCGASGPILYIGTADRAESDRIVSQKGSTAGVESTQKIGELTAHCPQRDFPGSPSSQV
jgi:hypothetical protein